MRYSKASVAAAFCLLAGSLHAQDTVAVRFSKNVTAAHLSEYLHKLASDEFEGRETGQKGQKLAAEYIAAHFKSLGIPPLSTGVYTQQYQARKELWDGYSVQLNDKDGHSLIDVKGAKPEKDILSFNGSCAAGSGDFNSLLLLGYGIESDNYNDYKGQDVKGKVLVFFENEPMAKDSTYFVSKTKEKSEWVLSRQKKMKTAADKGAAAVVFIWNNFEENSRNFGNYVSFAPLKLVDGAPNDKAAKIPTFYLGPDKIDALLPKGMTVLSIQKEIAEKHAPVAMELKAQFKFDVKKKNEIITAENVLGYVQGTDLKDELVIITGHYDHLGIDNGKIYYGADDDGSGTSAVMELARAFTNAKNQGHGPRRSMLFMTVSGEEKGLLGSEYYSEHPVFPLASTVTDLNIDMIGRQDEKYKDNPDYVYVIGSAMLSTELRKISEQANDTYTKLKLDYMYDDPKDPNRFYYRSDHYNFAKHNIPIAFYFNGVHADYHKPTDTVDKINFSKMEKITKLVFFTAWDLANRQDRIKVDAVKK